MRRTSTINGNVEQEVVLVGHNVGRPTPTPFATKYADAERLVTLTTDDDAGTEVFTALTVDANDNAVVNKLIMSASFAPGSGSSNEITFDANDSGTPEDEADVVEGTYDGAPGAYRCNGTAACTVTVNAKGAVTDVSEGWVFIPAKGSRVHVVDPDYAHYGAWLRRTTDADGVLTYNAVLPIRLRCLRLKPAVMSQPLTGTATYKGNAVGVYVHNVLDPAGEVASATGGHFMADAELVANFGGADVAASKQDTISPAPSTTSSCPAVRLIAGRWS